jgi:hypothetical protein
LFTNNVIACNGSKFISNCKRYLDLLSSEQKEITTKIYESIEEQASKANISTFDFFKQKINYVDCGNNFSEHVVVDLLVKKYSFDKNRTFMEIIIVGGIICIFNGGSLPHILKQLTDYGTFLFDK